MRHALEGQIGHNINDNIDDFVEKYKGKGDLLHDLYEILLLHMKEPNQITL
jgi:hypothetical protein